ncbi:hypothetical protein HDU76_007091, partial [Blyttiomyces sp. JEL0837]
ATVSTHPRRRQPRPNYQLPPLDLEDEYDEDYTPSQTVSNNKVDRSSSSTSASTAGGATTNGKQGSAQASNSTIKKLTPAPPPAAALKQNGNDEDEEEVGSEGADEITRCVCQLAAVSNAKLKPGGVEMGQKQDDTQAALSSKPSCEKQACTIECSCFVLVCSEDDGGVMIQCEKCMVWQHCRCMGIPEKKLPKHYYCELCKPSGHPYFKLNGTKQHTKAATTTQSSASKAAEKPPTQTPKKRNTMNSREAAQNYTDLLPLLNDSTSPGSQQEPTSPDTAGNANGSGSTMATGGMNSPLASDTQSHKRKRSRDDKSSTHLNESDLSEEEEESPDASTTTTKRKQRGSTAGAESNGHGRSGSASHKSNKKPKVDTVSSGRAKVEKQPASAAGDDEEPEGSSKAAEESGAGIAVSSANGNGSSRRRRLTPPLKESNVNVADAVETPRVVGGADVNMEDAERGDGESPDAPASVAGDAKSSQDDLSGIAQEDTPPSKGEERKAKEKKTKTKRKYAAAHHEDGDDEREDGDHVENKAKKSKTTSNGKPQSRSKRVQPQGAPQLNTTVGGGSGSGSGPCSAVPQSANGSSVNQSFPQHQHQQSNTRQETPNPKSNQQGLRSPSPSASSLCDTNDRQVRAATPPLKVRNVSSRISMNEMRKRVKQMQDYISRLQVTLAAQHKGGFVAGVVESLIPPGGLRTRPEPVKPEPVKTEAVGEPSEQQRPQATEQQQQGQEQGTQPQNSSPSQQQQQQESVDRPISPVSSSAPVTSPSEVSHDHPSGISVSIPPLPTFPPSSTSTTSGKPPSVTVAVHPKTTIPTPPLSSTSHSPPSNCSSSSFTGLPGCAKSDSEPALSGSSSDEERSAPPFGSVNPVSVSGGEMSVLASAVKQELESHDVEMMAVDVDPSLAGNGSNGGTGESSGLMFGGGVSGNVGTSDAPRREETSMEILDRLQRKLIKFQERFGAFGTGGSGTGIMTRRSGREL